MTDVGSMAPDVSFDLADGSRAALAVYRGKPLVVYFYPKVVDNLYDWAPDNRFSNSCHHVHPKV